MQGLCRSYHRIRNEKIARHASVSYKPTDVAKIYSFPQGVTGAGVTVGIIELGGGFTATDLNAYFPALGLAIPKVLSVPVAGGSNSPDGPGGADGEVLLDIEVAGAVAPGAVYRVYFAPNTDAGFLAAIKAAISDGCDILSISWGGPEDSWPQQSMQAMDAAFAASVAANVNVFVAAGDNGSSDGESGLHADFPSSSPNVVSCGGTTLIVTAAGQRNEIVWNNGLAGGATGGGVSVAFPKPLYQGNVIFQGSGRGAPDVAGNADPNTGYVVQVDGQVMTIGGTSAVAPLYAGLCALIQQALGKRVPFFNPAVYANAAKVCVDITSGNNGAYAAKLGYDLCTGNGVLTGASLLSVLAGQTPTPTPTPTPPTPTPTPPTPTPPPFPPSAAGVMRFQMEGIIDGVSITGAVPAHVQIQGWNCLKQ